MIDKTTGGTPTTPMKTKTYLPPTFTRGILDQSIMPQGKSCFLGIFHKWSAWEDERIEPGLAAAFGVSESNIPPRQFQRCFRCGLISIRRVA